MREFLFYSMMGALTIPLLPILIPLIIYLKIKEYKDERENKLAWDKALENIKTRDRNGKQ